MPVANLAVNCFDLSPAGAAQLSVFEEYERKRQLVTAVDTINKRWGDRSVTSALTLETSGKILDRIAFGKVEGGTL